MIKRLFTAILLLIALCLSLCLVACNNHCKHEDRLVIQMSEATCTEDGSTLYVCRQCSATWAEYQSASHELVNRRVSPTCRLPERQIHFCKNCDYYRSTVISPAVECKFITQYQPATCLKEGYEKRVCVWCGKQESYTAIARLSHLYVLRDGFVDCYYCKAVLRSDCAHSFLQGDAVSPTCTTPGYTPLYCTKCSCEVISELSSPCEHSYSPIEQILPTCTKKGICVYSCSGCGNQKTQDLAPSPHSGETTCSVCNSQISSLYYNSDTSLRLAASTCITLAAFGRSYVDITLSLSPDLCELTAFNKQTGEMVTPLIQASPGAFTYRISCDCDVILCIDVLGDAPANLTLFFAD